MDGRQLVSHLLYELRALRHVLHGHELLLNHLMSSVVDHTERQEVCGGVGLTAADIEHRRNVYKLQLGQSDFHRLVLVIRAVQVLHLQRSSVVSAQVVHSLDSNRCLDAIRLVVRLILLGWLVTRALLALFVRVSVLFVKGVLDLLNTVDKKLLGVFICLVS